MSRDDTAREVVLQLPLDVDAPALARAIVTEHGANLPGDLLDDARLLVSELVGNAVRYGQSEITLRLRTNPPGIGVAVADRGEQLPTMPGGQPDPTQPSGRGLLIVAAIATRWGIDPTRPGPGKTVWFELAPTD